MTVVGGVAWTLVCHSVIHYLNKISLYGYTTSASSFISWDIGFQPFG